jgi:Flp pilus assembly protein TadD
MKRLILGLLVVFAAALSAQTSPVRVWQGTLTLPTYMEGLPDPNPPFDQYATSRFNYPYTLRNDLTGERKAVAWRALYLENEYLRCVVLPDLGGHLYTCTDKISGQPMFYANPSIKKAMIGYRGAWAAFGMEFNFPVSHNWMSMSPVDFATQRNPDGSASILVGNIDRAYGMQWTVRLTLQPGETLLRQEVTLANNSDARHRFYWWNNAAVRVWNDSRAEYPMRYTASHGFREISPWPVVNGKDLSVIANETDGPVSLFAYGTREPFTAIWNPHTSTGTAHFASVEEVPGKKFWSWGAGADGLGWRKALSDDNSAYVEVQSGLFRDQETYAFLEPAQTVHFTEYWMPVRGTGGITRANLAAVLHLERHAAVLHAALNVNHAMPGARIRMTSGDKVLQDAVANLRPEQTWTEDLPVAGTPGPVSFQLLDRQGAVQLEQTEGYYDWDDASKVHTGEQPAWAAPEKPKRTPDDWLREGERQELLGNIPLALQTYEQARDANPGSLALKLAEGRLLVSLSRFREARPLLEQCASAEAADAEVGYLLGQAREGLGDVRGALDAYGTAYRQSTFRAAAGLRLGEIFARTGDSHAVAMLRAALEASPQDQRIAEELSIVEPVTGPAVEPLLQRFPLSAVLMEQTQKPDLLREAADPYLLLRVAGTYMRLGQWSHALAILTRQYPAVEPEQQEPGTLAPAEHPLVLYAAALCAARAGKPHSTYLDRAAKASITGTFPWSEVDLSALRFALQQRPDDPQAHALLGDLLFARGEEAEGTREWKAALALDQKLPVVGAQLGKAQLLRMQDAAAATATLLDAEASDPRNPEIYVALDQAMSLQHASANERARALDAYPDKQSLSSDLLFQLALTLAEDDRFDDALALFHHRFVASEEGEVSAAQVQFEIGLMRAERAARSGHCSEAPAPGAESNLDGAHAMDLWRLGRIAKQCGRSDTATSYFKQAAALTDHDNLAWADRAARELPGYDAAAWRAQLLAALAAIRSTASRNAWAELDIAALEQELGERGFRDEAIRAVFLLPDKYMSHHLARELEVGGSTR